MFLLLVFWLGVQQNGQMLSHPPKLTAVRALEKNAVARLYNLREEKGATLVLLSAKRNDLSRIVSASHRSLSNAVGLVAEEKHSVRRVSCNSLTDTLVDLFRTVAELQDVRKNGKSLAASSAKDR